MGSAPAPPGTSSTDKTLGVKAGHRRPRALELRVLVDGVAMAGKSTLVQALVAELEKRGVPAVRHRGMLAGLHPLQPLLRQLSSARQPDSWWTTTAYLIGGFLLDGLLVRLLPPRPRGHVIVQDGYGDRTVAFGMAGGPYLAAALALRWPRAFARFDLAVFLHASPEARAVRLEQGRAHIDVRDERTVHDNAFTERFHAFHLHGMGRRHDRLMVFDSSRRRPDEMAREVADRLLEERALTAPNPAGPRPTTTGTAPEGAEVTVVDPPRTPSGDGDRVWHPWTPIQQTERLTLVAGRGCHVEDDRGRSYLDLRSGTLNAAVGYGHPAVVEAISGQASRLMTWDLAEVSTLPARKLAARIASLLPAPLEYTLFCNSGSEATEAAVKIARMWHRLQGQPSRTTVMSFADGYHGATTAAIAATSAPFRRDGAGPLPDGYAHLATPRCAPCAAGGNHAECHVPGVAEWEAQIQAVGPESVAAVLVEPFLSVGGVIVPAAGDLAGLRALCDRHGILLIADEVATGFGRTGRMFGFEHDLGADGPTPDIITTAKGLTGGYAPLAAVTVREDIYRAFAGDPLLGGLRHGHTTGGHATACAAALAVLDIVEGDKLVTAAAARGEQLLGTLAPLKEVPAVRDVRGRGLLIGVEVASMELASVVARAAQERGVLIRAFGPVLTVAPPLVISAEEAEEGARALSDAIRSVTVGGAR